MVRRIATVFMVAALAVLGVSADADAAQRSRGVVQTPRSLSVGKVPANTTVVLAFTVTNKGSDPVTNTGFSLSYSGAAAGFASGSIQLDMGTCVIGAVLAPGESCSYSYSGTTSGNGRVRDGEVCYLIGFVDVSQNACSRFSLTVTQP